MARSSASVARLRSELARLLKHVERGEEIVVTRHGRGIAKLVPVTDKSERRAISGVHPAQEKSPLPRIRPSELKLRRSLTRAVLEDRG